MNFPVCSITCSQKLLCIQTTHSQSDLWTGFWNPSASLSNLTEVRASKSLPLWNTSLKTTCDRKMLPWVYPKWPPQSESNPIFSEPLVLQQVYKNSRASNELVWERASQLSAPETDHECPPAAQETGQCHSDEYLNLFPHGCRVPT